MGQLFQTILLGPWISRSGDQKMSSVTAEMNQEDLTFLKELVEAGKIAPVIDKRYSLREVPDALRYLGAGHARGKVVITVV